MTDRSFASNRSSQSGVALIAAIAGLVLASAIVLGMTSLARVEVLSSFNYRQLVQADTLGEAGLNRGIEWLSYTYPTLAGATDISNFDDGCYPVVAAGDLCTDPGVRLAGIDANTANYPLADVQTAFAAALSAQPVAVADVAGDYSLDAEMLAVRQVTTGVFQPLQVETSEKWRLTSESSVLGATSRQTMIVERVFQSFFAHALYGICSVNRVAGSSITDSYDSNLGPYGGANAFDVDAGVGSNGQVWTNGTSLAIGGDVAYGPGTGGCPAGDPSSVNPAVVNGEVAARPPRTFPPLPPFPPPSANNISHSSAVPLLLPPGNYGTVTVQGNGVVGLQGGTEAAPTVYYMENLSETGNNATIQIFPTGGHVILHVRGTPIAPSPASLTGCADYGLYLGGTGILSGVPPPPPSSVRINYYGTNCLVIAGAATASATIYAPEADGRLGGTGQFYGSVIARTTELYGDRQLHYDTDLQNRFGTLSPAKVLSYSRSRF